MGLFPSLIEQEEELTDDINRDLEIPHEYEVDFETGQLTGKVVEGIEAIKVWVYFALNTPRYRFYIHSWDYGNEIEDLIGQGYSEELIESEARRMIEECLTVSEFIDGIEDFTIDFYGNAIKCKFTVNTVYGDIESSTYDMEAD